ncbi:TetR/AcrR family transcriptional regulator [Tsukamurella soli]|uniref:TetR/AcrR family transcriptional regulator n=1 Tax=Tsukamurella soli TaxID=644556 RepID=A0ABP8K3T4_9ACTN
MARPVTDATVRKRDSERTRRDIIDIATKEFADKGYAGARVDEIAERTHTTKRMLYYYFGDKDGLYRAVLEHSYGRIRAQERRARIDESDPVTAVRQIAEITFDHHDRNPDFIRIVAGENILKGAHMNHADQVAGMGSPALDVLRPIVERGREQGVFRDDIDALDVHQAISSYCFFRVANRYTWKSLFGQNLTAPDERARQRRILGDMIVALLTTPAQP